jgi:hypothetical protein
MKGNFARLAALTMACVCVPAGSAFAAAGWTDFGTITEFNQNPSTTPGNEALFLTVTVPVGSNPSDASACHTRQGFYLPVTTEFQKRLFAIVMAAKLTDRRVRIYVTANCHLWGYAEIQGVVVE